MKHYRGKGPGSGAGGKVSGTRKRRSFAWGKIRHRLAEAKLGENFAGDPSWREEEKPLTHKPFKGMR